MRLAAKERRAVFDRLGTRQPRYFSLGRFFANGPDGKPEAANMGAGFAYLCRARRTPSAVSHRIFVKPELVCELGISGLAESRLSA